MQHSIPLAAYVTDGTVVVVVVVMKVACLCYYRSLVDGVELTTTSELGRVLLW